MAGVLIIDIEDNKALLTVNGELITVTNDGRVFGSRKELKQRLYQNYPTVTLGRYKRSRVRVHRLVAVAFLPNPEKLETVNHKDKNTQNNHVSNLEWCSREDNVKHGLSKPVIAHKDGYGIWFPSQSEAGRCGFIQTNISKCINGERPMHKGFYWING